MDRRDDALLPLGHFQFSLRAPHHLILPTRCRQSLSLPGAVLSATQTFPQQIEVRQMTFVIPKKPMVAIQRTITNRSEETVRLLATFSYVFDAPDATIQQPPRGVRLEPVHTGVSCGFFEYQADTTVPSDGMLSIKTTVPNIRPTADDIAIHFTASLVLKPAAAKQLDFFIFLCDQQDTPDYPRQAYQIKNSLRVSAFQTMLAEHQLAWKETTKHMDLILPDTRLTTVYRAAIYSLLCCAQPKAGIPDGISASHNQARISGLTELFAVNALLRAGFGEQARNPTLFRRMTMPAQAGYPLFADETGAPSGPCQTWPLMLSHNAHIALAAWQTATFTRDSEFLKNTAYPVIRAVAQFFATAAICQLPQNQAEDLAPAMVPSVDFPSNGKATTLPLGLICAVAATLNAAEQAALELECDQCLRLQWSSLARKILLIRTQTAQAQPHPLAPFAGIFPYLISENETADGLPDLDQLLQQAEDIPAPDGTAPAPSWTCAWIAALAARMKRPELAVKALAKAASSADAFGQLPHSIADRTGIHRQPWFLPAQATFATALATMLLQSGRQEIFLLPATPQDWDNLDFTLPCVGGIKVRFKLRKGTVTHLTLANSTPQPTRRIITLPSHVRLPHPMQPTRSYSIPPYGSLRIF